MKDISANEYELYQEIEKEIEYIFFKSTPIDSYIKKYRNSRYSLEERCWYYDFHHKHFKNDFADYKKKYIDSLSISLSEYIYKGLANEKDFIQEIDNFILHLKSLNSIHENFISASLQYIISNFIVQYGVLESSFPKYFGGLIDSLLNIDSEYLRIVTSNDFNPDNIKNDDEDYFDILSIYSEHYAECSLKELLDLEIYSGIAIQCFDYFNDNYNTELDFYFKNGLASYYICKNYASNLHSDREIFVEKYQRAIHYLHVPVMFYNNVHEREKCSNIDCTRMIYSKIIFDRLRDELVIPGVDNQKFFDQNLELIKQQHEKDGNMEYG